MKTNIRNIDDLRAERARLKNEIEISRTKIHSGITGIKEELSPARHVMDFLSNFLTKRNKGLLGIGVGIGVDTIVKNGILRNASWITKLVVPYLIKNFTNNMIQTNKDNILEKGLEWVKDVTDDKPVLTEVKNLNVYKPSLTDDRKRINNLSIMITSC